MVSKPLDRPTVVAYINCYLVWICDWCSSWYILLNPSKTKALVSRSRTVYHPHGDLVLSCAPILTNLALTFLVQGLTASLSLQLMCFVLCHKSHWELVQYLEDCEWCLCRHICVASFLLCIHPPYPWVLFSCFGICCHSYLQLLECQVCATQQFVLTRLLYLFITTIALLDRVCCMKFTAIWSTVCMVIGSLPVIGARHNHAAAAAHTYEFEVLRCSSQDVSCLHWVICGIIPLFRVWFWHIEWI